MCKKIICITIILILIFLISCSSSDSNEINISVAASLTEPINKIVEEYEKDKDIEININSGGSGILKNQILQGADVALFFSANTEYVDNLIDEGVVQASDVSNRISNNLILIKSDNNEVEEIKNIEELKNSNLKIAIGDVGTVPAGQYAKEVLENTKVWETIEEDIIFAKDVSSVRTYVEIGEVDYGFVYKSDSINLKNSKVILEIDSSYHEEIKYSLAILDNYSDSEEVEALVDFINSEEGLNIFKEYGFKARE